MKNRRKTFNPYLASFCVKFSRGLIFANYQIRSFLRGFNFANWTFRNILTKFVKTAKFNPREN